MFLVGEFIFPPKVVFISPEVAVEWWGRFWYYERVPKEGGSGASAWRLGSLLPFSESPFYRTLLLVLSYYDNKTKGDCLKMDKEKMVSEIVRLLDKAPEKAAVLVLNFLYGYLEE